MSLLHPNPNFPKFIRKTLERIDLPSEHLELLTNDDSLMEFTKVFTRVSIDPIHNNEFYEIIGDTTSNKIVVDYFVNRFKNLFGTGSAEKGEMGPVAIMARLKQRYISKSVFSKFADKMEFWDYIRRKEEEDKDKTRMCEDAFEAFIGCLEKLCNNKIYNGTGFYIASKIMNPLLDDLNIKESDLTLKSLYDYKSQLNSLIISNKTSVEIKYSTIVNEENEEDYQNRFTSILDIMDLSNGNKFTTPNFNWSLKTESENLAAKYAIENKIIENILSDQVKRGVIRFEKNLKGNLIPRRIGIWKKYSLTNKTSINPSQISNYINNILNMDDIEIIKLKLLELNQLI